MQNESLCFILCFDIMVTFYNKITFVNISDDKHFDCIYYYDYSYYHYLQYLMLISFTNKILIC